MNFTAAAAEPRRRNCPPQRRRDAARSEAFASRMTADAGRPQVRHRVRQAGPSTGDQGPRPSALARCRCRRRRGARLFVTPRVFAPEAEHYAASAPIDLVDGAIADPIHAPQPQGHALAGKLQGHCPSAVTSCSTGSTTTMPCPTERPSGRADDCPRGACAVPRATGGTGRSRRQCTQTPPHYRTAEHEHKGRSAAARSGRTTNRCGRAC